MITAVTVSASWPMLDSMVDASSHRTYEDEFDHFIHADSYDNTPSPAHKRQRTTEPLLAVSKDKIAAPPSVQDAIRYIICNYVTEAVSNEKFCGLHLDNLAVQVCRDMFQCVRHTNLLSI